MKTTLFLLLLTSFALYSQEKPIAIEYDQSGNRVLRSSLSIETRGASVSNTPGDSLTMSDEVNGYTVELLLSNWARSSSFPNGWYKAWEHKAMIYTTKDLFYSLSLR